jgi:hypothetical protein
MKSIVSRILMPILAGGLLLAGLAPGTAVAARGGKPSPAGAATLAVTPNPAAAFSYVHANGCGYSANQAVQINVISSTAIAASNFPVGADGCFGFSWYVYGPDTYTFKAYENAGGKRPTLVASTTLIVQ